MCNVSKQSCLLSGITIKTAAKAVRQLIQMFAVQMLILRIRHLRKQHLKLIISLNQGYKRLRIFPRIESW